ncbi:TonB-dependent receptor [Pseudoxanthomonas composti]|uniref:TonB-dependent receptor n=1 Tax=Pseudoxanthomonas composti TaxID=2137479 RepID=A0A4V1N162_9GAMM|nr:TonB-dependent receptor [Pseudoxanthomonas composti]RXR06154.1 TonB-dependent receptor [Pseudoxanthomonas composti]
MSLSSRTRSRNPLSAAIAFTLASCAVVPFHALAQQAAVPAEQVQTQASAPSDQSTEATNLDTVAVTGYRYAIEKSLDQKRNANAIVEVITAEDVGKFPDKNVADALQRVPGVIITRDGGEGKNVSVRGLSSELTLTELNGNYVATAETNGDPTRSFNYTLLPSNLLSSSELFKTPEARIDEGGIGGTVILHTRRPLEQEANSGFVSAEGTYADTTEKTDGQFAGSYSWHDKEERFGVFVGYTQQKRTVRTLGANTSAWNWYTDDRDTRPATDVYGNPNGFGSYWYGESGFNDQNGNSYVDFMMPNVVNFQSREEDRERKGGQLTLQFKPHDNLTMTANYFRFDLEQEQVTNTLSIPEWNLARYRPDDNWEGGRLLDGLSFDPSGTIVTGAEYRVHPGKTYYCSNEAATAAGIGDPVEGANGFGPDDCTIPTPWIAGGYNRQKARSQTADFELAWRTEDLDVIFKGGRTWATGGPEMVLSMPVKPRRPNAGGNGTTLNGDGSYTLGNYYTRWDLSGTPSLTVSPEVLENLRNGIGEIDLGSTGSTWTRNSTWQKFAQTDFTWRTDAESTFLDSVQFGVKYRDGGTRRSTGNNYWVCQGADPADYDSRYQAGCDPAASVFRGEFLQPGSLGNIAGGFNTNVFPAINYPGYIDYLNNTYGPMQTRQEDNFVYNVEEKIYSAYLQANFRTERLRGNLGLRIVKTEQYADSTDRVDYFNDYFFDDAAGNPIPCLPGNLPAAGAPAGSGCISGFTTLPDSQTNPASGHISTFVVTSLDRSYVNRLPSLNVSYDLTDTLLLRGAASRVMSRPGYNALAAPGSLNFYSEEYVNDRRLIGGGDQQGWFGSGSNKALMPYLATQYDLGLEWYFQPGSVAGIGLFRKNVSNFTLPVQQDITQDIGGQTVTVQNFSTTASGRDAVSEGVEVYAQHTFDFGLGLQANYTYNRTNEAAVTLADGTDVGKSPLVGSAANQTNLTVFYEKGPLLLRASYNRRGEVVEGLVSRLNVYQEPYTQIDLNAAYNFTPALSVTASVLNLTEEETRSYLGNDTQARFNSNSYAGRIAFLGVNYKF